jgi:hypothetical protein
MPAVTVKCALTRMASCANTLVRSSVREPGTKNSDVDAHLTKPVDPADVERVLADLLSAGAPRNVAGASGSIHSA